MANQPWYKEKNRLADENKRLRTIASQLMIAGAGGSPGQPYTPPKEDPKNPYVPAPSRKLASANTSLSPSPIDLITFKSSGPSKGLILINI